MALRDSGGKGKGKEAPLLGSSERVPRGGAPCFIARRPLLSWALRGGGGEHKVLRGKIMGISKPPFELETQHGDLNPSSPGLNCKGLALCQRPAPPRWARGSLQVNRRWALDSRCHGQEGTMQCDVECFLAGGPAAEQPAPRAEPEPGLRAGRGSCGVLHLPQSWLHSLRMDPSIFWKRHSAATLSHRPSHHSSRRRA